MFDFRRYMHKLNNYVDDVEYTLREIDVSTSSYIVGQVPSICYDVATYDTKYYLAPVTYTLPYPASGHVLYDDSGLTTPFDGDELFYKIKWDDGTASSKVDNSGIISLVSLCTQVIELGYSNSSSSEACDNQFGSAGLYYTTDLAIEIFSDEAMTTPALPGYYAGFLPFGGFINKEWRQWNGTSFTSSGDCF